MSQRLTSQAINELAPNAEYTIIDGVIDWQSKDIDQPSNEAIEAKKLEIAVINARAEEYPSILEFIEAYTEKEIGGDTTKWDAYVVKYNQVRTDNPKPSE